MRKKYQYDDIEEAYKEGYRKGHLEGRKLGYEEGYKAGEKDGILIAIRGYAHMNGDYGEGKSDNGNEDRTDK